jgi:capsular exopolysaccharide synthesis family protein
MLSGKDTNPKTILLASALPGEGKSSLALAIAHMMANVGKRVIIIDCDLRKPTIHKNFSALRTPGLTECLNGQAALNVVIQKDPESSIFFISAGGDAQTSPDLFGSDAMRALLKELSAVYDLVLLDGAPVLGVSDTRHLSRIVDRTVFVVRWQSTRCAAVELGLRLLLDANATIAGTLLTMIDPKFYEKSSPIGIYRRRLALYVN